MQSRLEVQVKEIPIATMEHQLAAALAGSAQAVRQAKDTAACCCEKKLAEAVVGKPQ